MAYARHCYFLTAVSNTLRCARSPLFPNYSCLAVQRLFLSAKVDSLGLPDFTFPTSEAFTSTGSLLSGIALSGEPAQNELLDQRRDDAFTRSDGKTREHEPSAAV